MATKLWIPLACMLITAAGCASSGGKSRRSDSDGRSPSLGMSYSPRYVPPNHVPRSEKEERILRAEDERLQRNDAWFAEGQPDPDRPSYRSSNSLQLAPVDLGLH